MKVYCVLVAFLVLAAPAMAEDLSPWFGSEASTAEQISFQKQSEITLQINQQAALEAPVECMHQGCPATQETAK